ncbi:hypothetical protein A2U01_0088819, partial [Trifolium medium]|nr:hypothetical protein [Trifolium medium]
AGATAAVDELEGGNKDTPAADDGAGVAQPSSSQTAPASTPGAAPSLWDPLFNPMEFI